MVDFVSTPRPAGRDEWPPGEYPDGWVIVLKGDTIFDGHGDSNGVLA